MKNKYAFIDNAIKKITTPLPLALSALKKQTFKLLLHNEIILDVISLFI